MGEHHSARPEEPGVRRASRRVIKGGMGMNKKNLLAFMSILFLIVKLFSYQASEKYLVSGGLNFSPSEKTAQGFNSKVVMIKDMRQFSSEVVNNQKPVVVKIFSNKSANSQMKPVYQSLADQIGDVVSFAAINLDMSHQIKLMLQKILGFDEAQLPLIIFFKNGQMILPAFSGTVNKQNLFKLVKSRFGGKLVSVNKESISKIKDKQQKDEPRAEIVLSDPGFEMKQETVLRPLDPSTSSGLEDQDDREKEKIKESIWKKLKSAFWSN